jgi:hypothetical protein
MSARSAAASCQRAAQAQRSSAFGHAVQRAFERSALQPQWTYLGQLERRHGGGVADIEPQDVQLEP